MNGERGDIFVGVSITYPSEHRLTAIRMTSDGPVAEEIAEEDTAVEPQEDRFEKEIVVDFVDMDLSASETVEPDEEVAEVFEEIVGLDEETVGLDEETAELADLQDIVESVDGTVESELASISEETDQSNFGTSDASKEGSDEDKQIYVTSLDPGYDVSNQLEAMNAVGLALTEGFHLTHSSFYFHTISFFLPVFSKKQSKRFYNILNIIDYLGLYLKHICMKLFQGRRILL